ncbi:hypothetical protein NMY22_g9228 [Coprinellus aureogranulatus]|nr:hypothetical protein NMY22_g9228 [Coprinellus aureogranulatus]
MESSPSTLKRKRTEETTMEAAAEEPKPTRSKKVWFKDGNIVIQVKRTNVQFKVHQGVLSRQSSVFAGLFDVPHPSSEPTVDGCPVVELHDSAVDMENALLALYGDPDHIGTMKKPQFASISAMIRIGKKYEMYYLRDEGLARLKRQFPTTLQEYDEFSGTRADSALRQSHRVRISRLDELFHIINLATECSMQSILPTLYLQAASYGLYELLFEAKVEIPQNVLRRLIHARETLIQAKRGQVSDYGRSEECYSPENAALLRSSS